MSDMEHEVADPREAARMIGEMLGREDLTEAILEGAMSATQAQPLVAGIVHQSIVMVAVPILKAESWTGFNPEAVGPMQALLHLKDGTALMVTIEAI